MKGWNEQGRNHDSISRVRLAGAATRVRSPFGEKKLSGVDGRTYRVDL